MHNFISGKTLSIFILTISLISISCNSSKEGITSSKNEVEIISSTQTILVSGASGIKGRRISISLIKLGNITLDSIQYESFFQSVNIIKTNNDTVFIDAHFYPIYPANSNLDLIGDRAFKSNQCTLFYHSDKKSKSKIISDLKMVTDPTKWK